MNIIFVLINILLLFLLIGAFFTIVITFSHLVSKKVSRSTFGVFSLNILALLAGVFYLISYVMFYENHEDTWPEAIVVISALLFILSYILLSVYRKYEEESSSSTRETVK